LETQKYIHSIRKPIVIDQREAAPLPVLREERRIVNKAKDTRKEERQACYSIKYFGDINGEIGVQTHKVPISRPTTTKPLLTSLSLDTFSPSTPASRCSPRLQVHVPWQVLQASTSLSPSEKAASVFTFEVGGGRLGWRKQGNRG